MQKMGAHRLLERKSPRFESDGCAVAPPKEVERFVYRSMFSHTSDGLNKHPRSFIQKERRSVQGRTRISKLTLLQDVAPLNLAASPLMVMLLRQVVKHRDWLGGCGALSWHLPSDSLVSISWPHWFQTISADIWPSARDRWGNGARVLQERKRDFARTKPGLLETWLNSSEESTQSADFCKVGSWRSEARNHLGNLGCKQNTIDI